MEKRCEKRWISGLGQRRRCIGVRVGEDEVSSSHHGSCSVECSFCGGTGHTAKPCRRCNGQKYLLSRKNLRHLYVEEYKVMEALLKSLSEQ